jgi:hypothetical protein
MQRHKDARRKRRVERAARAQAAYTCPSHSSGLGLPSERRRTDDQIRARMLTVLVDWVDSTVLA